MIIAVPTRNGRVDDHFGQCDFFTLNTVSPDGLVREKSLLTAPQGCGCRSNLIELLLQGSVTHMLAGHMGEGAYHRLGAIGDTDALVAAYLKGILQDSGEGCEDPHQHLGDDCGRHHPG